MHKVSQIDEQEEGRDPPRQAKRMKQSPPKDSGQDRTFVLRPRPPTSTGADAKMGLTSSSRLKRKATIMYVPRARTTCHIRCPYR